MQDERLMSSPVAILHLSPSNLSSSWSFKIPASRVDFSSVRGSVVCLAGLEGPMCGQLFGESTVSILEVLVVYSFCRAAVLLWLSVRCGDVPCLHGQV